MSEPVKEYVWSPDECMARAHGVCSGCGGKLEPIETVDNGGHPTFWPGCQTCSRFDYGVPPEVFAAAVALFGEGKREYSHLDPPGTGPGTKEPGYADYYRSAQICGLCSTVQSVLRHYKPLPAPPEQPK